MKELDLIRAIAAREQKGRESLECGIGDDCAIFRPEQSEDILITTDMLIEHVHFDTRWHPPYLLGRKAAAANLSDIAAMAGEARYALLSVGMTPRQDTVWIDDFIEGFFSRLRDHDCTLIGGDTVASENLTLSVTIIGAVLQGAAVRRRGAAPGDIIYVSGPLGLAAAGLHYFKSGGRDNSQWPTSTKCHLDPNPRLDLARKLAGNDAVTSMQDVSDGIATDLRHICEASGVRAVIHSETVPGHEELYSFCTEYNIDPLSLQLGGGEDYELLFTLKQNEAEKMEREMSSDPDKKIYRIGIIEEGEGVHLRSADGEIVPARYKGYEHSA